jgi:leucyl-tRNA synthetase
MTGEREKTGAFTGAYATNPANGERLPIWIADYVLMTYGTGAIMAVPGHDVRDFEFAKKFGLPIREVIAPPTGPVGDLAEAYVGEGTMVNSGRFDGLAAKTDGNQQVCDWFESRGIGERSVQFRLRDWTISRQRYWGPPIPMIYCDKCGVVPVPDDHLPVILPDVEDYRPTGTGVSPLAQVESFVNTTCPTCGGPARRETDVSDNFLDSAWYFLRYPSANEPDVAWDRPITDKWLPVNTYIGGAEHSVLHLLYSRFINMALKDMGWLNNEEPYVRFRAHGLLTKDGGKMSKSKGNVVNPDDYIARYGADTLRMYLMFLGPYEQGGDFSDSGIGGVYRFLHRFWTLATDSALVDETPPIDALRVMHRTIRKCTEDLESLKYNTAIAALMEYLNFLQRQSVLHRQEIQTFVLLLAPLGPFISEELWERLGGGFSVHQQPWPAWDAALAALQTLSIPVQINGKTREVIEVAADADEESVKAAALGAERVQRHLAGKTVRRVIYVQGRMVNLVI